MERSATSASVPAATCRGGHVTRYSASGAAVPLRAGMRTHGPATGTQTCRPRHSPATAAAEAPAARTNPTAKGCDHGPADHSALRNQAEENPARDEQQHGAEAGDDGGDLHAAPLAPEAQSRARGTPDRGPSRSAPRRSGPPSPVRRGGASAGPRRHGDDLLEAARKGTSTVASRVPRAIVETGTLAARPALRHRAG